MEEKELFKKIEKTNLKELSYKELALLSEEIREYIIACCAENGGHLASNLGVIELTIALHKAFNFPNDKLLFDVGHQCYTHKILTGRKLSSLRKENGIDGFQKRNESEYDCFEAGHSSTSISSAMGLALNRDLNNEKYEVIAFIGDSSIANGLSFEAINCLQDFNHKIIIIMNDNNMSISQPIGALHNMLQNIRLSKRYLNMKSNFRKHMGRNKFTRSLFSFFKSIKDGIKHLLLRNNIFEMFGLYYIGNVDGYDFKEMEKAFNKAKKRDSSVIIHVTTIKGKGYNLSENSNVSSWHSVKPFDIKTGKSKTSINPDLIDIQSVYSKGIEKILQEDPKSILINPSTLVGSKMDELINKYKGRCIDVGISEEHAIVLACGFSLNKSHSYISIYSTFLQRCYDELNHDVCRMDLPITLLIDRSGLIGSDGETHQGIFDESFLFDLPNMSICMAKNMQEAYSLLEFSKNYNHPLAIRYSVDYFQKTNLPNIKIDYGKWIIEKESTSNICLISFGPNFNKLLKMNLNITYINAIFQSPIDEELLNYILNYKNIIIYDSYGIEDGFTLHVKNKLIDLNYKNKIHTISIKKAFIAKGTIEQQEKRCHVHIDDVISLINKL